MFDRVRLSPSGKFIGNPPLRQGAGTEGVRWRLHGSGARVSTPAAYTTIPGMTSVPVDMQPGYLYQIKSYVEIETRNLTVGAGGVSLYYRTRTAAGAVWQPWTALSLGTHEIPLTATPCNVTGGFQDCLNGITVAAPSDRLEIAVYGNANNGTEVALIPELAFADVSEYVS
jgi:hypothetical protein